MEKLWAGMNKVAGTVNIDSIKQVPPPVESRVEPWMEGLFKLRFFEKEK